MYGLSATEWITALNGKPIETLDDFIGRLRQLKDNRYVRLKTMSFDRVPAILSLKLNLHYWPTVLFQRNASTGEWTKTML